MIQYELDQVAVQFLPHYRLDWLYSIRTPADTITSVPLLNVFLK